MVLKLYSLWYQQGSLQGLAENTDVALEIRTLDLGASPLGSISVAPIQTNVYEPQVQEELDLKD